MFFFNFLAKNWSNKRGSKIIRWTIFPLVSSRNDHVIKQQFLENSLPQNMRPLQFSWGSLSQIFIELFNLDFTFRYFITTFVVTASILSDVWTGKITLWWCFGYQIHDWNNPTEGETTRLHSPEEAQRHYFSYRDLMVSRHDLFTCRFRRVRISPKSKVELIFPNVIRCNMYI